MLQQPRFTSHRTKVKDRWRVFTMLRKNLLVLSDCHNYKEKIKWWKPSVWVSRFPTSPPCLETRIHKNRLNGRSPIITEWCRLSTTLPYSSAYAYNYNYAYKINYTCLPPIFMSSKIKGKLQLWYWKLYKYVIYNVNYRVEKYVHNQWCRLVYSLLKFCLRQIVEGSHTVTIVVFNF